MNAWLLSLFPDAGTMKSIGSTVVIAGLVGEVGVLFVPSKKKFLEKTLSAIFIAVIAFGVWIERIADNAIGAPRVLNASQQATITNTVREYAPQRFRGAIGQGVGDGIPFWESLAPALIGAHWAYIGPSANDPKMGLRYPAFIAIVAASDVEILLPASTDATPRIVDAAKELTLALRNAGVWAYTDFDPQNTTDKTTITIRIGVKTR